LPEVARKGTGIEVNIARQPVINKTQILIEAKALKIEGISNSYNNFNR
jgi:hypothetical protein